MGHNVDFRGFGIFNIKCKTCGKEFDLSDVDIDCDLATHSPMCFELDLYCDNCNDCKTIKFKIIEEK
jgi:hypothetical protein